MQTIQVTRQFYKGESRLFLHFAWDELLVGVVRKIPGALWSSTNHGWHIPDNKETCASLEKVTKGIALIKYTVAVHQENTVVKKQLQQLPAYSTMQSLEKFTQYLTQKRYSVKTISTYTNGLKRFLSYINKPEGEITNQDLERFNHDYIVRNNYSFAFQNQVINAVKLFFRAFYQSNFKVEAVERPRREHRLPNVLSKEEVKRILEAPVNLKHRAMLSLIYACGLRRSELLNLKPDAIESKRGLLEVRQAKGNKDRVVPISDKVIDMLRVYYKAYKPKIWLFEGQDPGTQYSEQSLQSVLKHAVYKAGIRKKVTLHWLRHSYATHLLESGTDLRFIQELLGHKSSRTTEIYTHVTDNSLKKIRSPFDDL
jgi:integrase/recombinase XerD